MPGNIDKQKLINSIIASSGGKLNKSAVESAANGDMGGIMSGLSEEDKRKLNEALSDKEKAKQLLSSDAARAILNNLFGKQK